VKGPLKLTAPLVVALALAACNGGSSTMPGTAGQSALGSSVSGGHGRDIWGPNVVQVCGDAANGYAQCHVLLQKNGIKLAGNDVAGITATNIEQAYDLPSSTNGAGQTVAIVDAYNNPDVASDMAAYRSEFKLGTGKLTIYNQNGQTTNLPEDCPAGSEFGWCLEIDLDVQMVSAVCPKCQIDLIEGNSNSFSDLGAAEVEAVKLGAHIVTNSYGGECEDTCTTGGYGADYDTAGVTYLASAGDGGYADEFPAELDSVVSVGGSVLSPDSKSKRGWSEVAWPHTGGGCATNMTKPAWQDDPKCTGRMQNDVGAVAQNTAEYDTDGYQGWITVEGTSIASPLNAGIFALAGNATSQTGGKTFWKWRHEKTSHLWHISSGSDGSCSPTYFCTDGTHPFHNHKEDDYGGPTGWGTPHGIGAY
jgi:hypothetical protein